MPDIFLSYNREDAAIARLYVDSFTAEGFDVWWDSALKSGEAYDEVTENALRTANAVVVLWSPRSVVSRWVRAEATLADRAGTLVPVMVEPCERPIMFELVQTADLIGWKGARHDPVWKDFVHDVRRVMGLKSLPVAEDSAPEVKSLPLPTKPSVAVMPFANLGGGTDEDYFSDGIVVEIISALSRYHSLFVISSGTTLSYRGDSRTPAVAARELGVRYILHGSVRKAGQKVRIAVELLDEVALAPIWTQRFDGSLDDIFELQDEVSHAVASQIEPSIVAHEVRRAAAKPTSNGTAYDLYLRGIHAYWELWTKDSLSRAADRFKRAVMQDPKFAQAQAYASNALINCVLQGHSDDPLPMMAESAQFARAALVADRGDAEVLSLAAYTLFQCDEPLESVDRLLEQSLTMNPGISICYYTAGFINLYACRGEAALEAFDTALRLDPRTPWRDAIMIGKAQALFMLERYREALPIYAQAEIAFPEVAVAIRRISAVCHALLGDMDTALASPGVLDPITPNEEFLISRYREPAFRDRLYGGISLLAEGAAA